MKSSLPVVLCSGRFVVPGRSARWFDLEVVCGNPLSCRFGEGSVLRVHASSRAAACRKVRALGYRVISSASEVS